MLASRLFAWSHGKVSTAACAQYARAYTEGVLGDGLIKDFFDGLPKGECRVPTCTNQTTDAYCEDCLALKGVAAGLFKALGELLAAR